MPEKNYDIIVIGGGCAGLTAAIYARRASKSVLVLENQTFGGQIAYSPSVENFPGFKNISGLDFSDRLLEQATILGAETELENVINVKNSGEIKEVTTDYQKYSCKALIIATGLTHRKTGIENEINLVGRGVSYCAVCDGAFFKDKDVAVYGGGNTAVQDAIFLSDICRTVSIIHRRDKFRAESHLVENLKNKKNVNYYMNSVIESINGEESLDSISITNVVSKEKSQIVISGLFIAIGQIPQNDVVKNIVRLDDYGFIDSKEDCKTNIAGIYAAGDCRVKGVRQLTTAASDGSVAATNACHYIDNL